MLIGDSGRVEVESTLAGGALAALRLLDPSVKPGDAGGIAIRAQHFRAEGGTVSALSVASDAGDIEIRARNGIELFGSSVEANVGGGDETTGGNVALVAGDFVILDSDSSIVAQAVEGQGGNIEITTRGLFAYPGSTIDASSEFGLDGIVQINAPDTNLTATLAALPERYLDAAMARDQCALSPGEERGSFVLGGGTGIPEAPDAPLPSFSLAGGRALR